MTPSNPPSPMPYRPDPADTGPSASVPGLDYTDAGVPTLDHVRDRIECRHATALGGTELAEESAEGQARQRSEEERERAAVAALARIRASIRPADGRP